MTYSDVITLLMTFFILLLTFASNEPEKFERMKVSMFGGGGSAGIAGRTEEAVDRESLLLRFRPQLSRLTQRGTETPPMDTDAGRESLDRGLRALDERNDLAQKQRLSFSVARTLIVGPDGEPTTIGLHHLRLLANQLRTLPLQLQIAVPDAKDLPAALRMAELLTHGFQVPLGRVSVSRPASNDTSEFVFSITRER